MRLFRITYFIFICLLFSLHAAGKPETPVLSYDSVIVKNVSPAPVKEKEVFSEVDLSFAKTRENNDIGLLARVINWLANSVFGNTSYKSRHTLQWLFIWVFIGGGTLLAIWLFSRSEFGSFLRGNTKQSAFNFSDVEEDISGIDFNKKIEQAKADGDYRLAIRWLYLKQLFLLNEKNQIAWQPYKTNMDYSNELVKSTYRQAFKDISRIYEYVWYGKYAITQSSFISLEQQFKQFETAIHV